MTRYYVSAVYDVPGSDRGVQFGFDTEKERLIRQTAGASGGSGSGFGERDHAWYGLTKKSAAEKAEALKKIPGLRVIVNEQKF